MGTFLGHLLPGSFFFGFGSWWLWSIFCRYFLCRKTSKYFQSSLSFPCPCCPNAPLESWIIVISCTIGIIGETVTGFKDGHFAHIGNAQHITMFFFFGLTGAVNILMAKGAPFPKDSDYFFGTLAYLVESLLFHFHLYGRSGLDVHIHTLLLYTSVSGILACLAEMRHRGNVLSSLLRTYVTLLQGTWFIQIGFILYNPLPGSRPWGQDDHVTMMFVTAVFCWHMAAVLFYMAIVGAIAYSVVNGDVSNSYTKLASFDKLLNSVRLTKDTEPLTESANEDEV